MASRKKKPIDLTECFAAIDRVKEIRASGDQESKEYQAAVEKATRLFLLAHGETKVGVDTPMSHARSPKDVARKSLSINEIFDILNGDLEDF